jgi:N-acyl-D-aspartate/D-glutamate deacylase
MDYIIKDGWIVNGKKEKPFHGDLAIENGKIRYKEYGTSLW